MQYNIITEDGFHFNARTTLSCFVNDLSYAKFILELLVLCCVAIYMLCFEDGVQKFMLMSDHRKLHYSPAMFITYPVRLMIIAFSYLGNFEKRMPLMIICKKVEHTAYEKKIVVVSIVYACHQPYLVG